MQEARIFVRKPKEEKISPHTWHGQGLLDGGSLRDACTATVAVAEFCFGWYWEVIQGSLNGTHFEGVELDAYNVAGSFEGYPEEKNCLVWVGNSSWPLWLEIINSKVKDGFWVAKKRVPKIVVFFIGWKKKGCVFCGGNVGKRMIEVHLGRQIAFFLKQKDGWIFVFSFLTSHRKSHDTDPTFSCPGSDLFPNSSPNGWENP